ncbi:hypothetical protein BZG01_11895 [Labilibaculum manganireducens]|uniref:Uncharacterized protein n=1 Tax=Labilibaculum manganireducens TaxID=1940525 RepID=A0A2N3I7L6_9BACT|nr:hypothetical protein [Labilibaculum manganireducens]PKQ66286.1 hypothetical protein BZG01_11895 [Labilibaculum manganireducens]
MKEKDIDYQNLSLDELETELVNEFAQISSEDSLFPVEEESLITPSFNAIFPENLLQPKLGSSAFTLGVMPDNTDGFDLGRMSREQEYQQLMKIPHIVLPVKFENVRDKIRDISFWLLKELKPHFKDHPKIEAFCDKPSKEAIKEVAPELLCLLRTKVINKLPIPFTIKFCCYLLLLILQGAIEWQTV